MPNRPSANLTLEFLAIFRHIVGSPNFVFLLTLKIGQRNESDLLLRWTSRHSLALCWLLLTLTVASFALLKSSPSASELFFLPTDWAHWLDVNYDVRTVLLTFGVALPPALILHPNSCRWERRGMLSAVLVLLVGCEFAQLAMPKRGFGWPDIGYTVLGIFVCETLVVGIELFANIPRKISN